jgi:hypothetical protein
MFFVDFSGVNTRQFKRTDSVSDARALGGNTSNGALAELALGGASATALVAAIQQTHDDVGHFHDRRLRPDISAGGFRQQYTGNRSQHGLAYVPRGIV